MALKKLHTPVIVFLFLLLNAGRSEAQPIHSDYFDAAEEVLKSELYFYGTNFHPNIKPYYRHELYLVQHPDSVFNFKIPKENRFYGKVLKENLISYQAPRVFIAADPLLDITGGYVFSEKKSFVNSGIGCRLETAFFSKLSLGGSMMYHQSLFPAFIDEKIQSQRALPGHSYAYRSAIGGYNFLDYDFYLAYHFLKYFTAEAGFGKNFWGDGYRTFFLSDHAYNYPYLKLTTNVWNIKLVNLYANFKDMTGIESGRWSKMTNKYGAFHYLSWDISRRVNLGFFESIIWQGRDSSGNRGFEAAYLNPVIFFRPVEFSRGSPDNSLLGVSLRIKIGNNTSVYGQLLIDDIVFGEVKNGLINRIKRILHPKDSTLTYGYWTNKQAGQIGIKSYDIFKVKNLSALLEVNLARPYTFAHRLVIQNYGHYNQPLAHPAGANFWEVSAFLRYSYKRWFFEGHLNYLQTGVDTTGSCFGQDIYKPVWDAYDAGLQNVVIPQYFHKIGQGVKTKIACYSLNVSYLLNPKNNLRFVLDYMYRSSDSKIKQQYTHSFLIGLRMSVTGKHYDF